MVVDLLEKDRVNVKDLTLNKPETQPLFDPNRDITAQDLEWIKVTFQKDFLQFGEKIDDKEWTNFPALALRVLFQDKLTEIGLNDKVFRGMRADLQDDLHTRLDSLNFFGDFLDEALNFKIFFQERSAEVQTLFNQMGFETRIYPRLKREIDANKENRRFFGTSLTHRAKTMLGLFPVQSTRDQVFDESAFRILEVELGEARGRKPLLFSERAAVLRLAFPERFAEVSPNRDDWQGMVYLLNSYSHRVRLNDNELNRDDFCELAANMKILAAKRVDIDEKGIRVIMPSAQQPVAAIPDVPQGRKF